MNASPAMGGPMRDQILGQPAALRMLLARREEIARRLGTPFGGTPRNISRIWAVGHGDSYFAPLAAEDAFRRWTAVTYRPMLSQEMAAYPPGLDDSTLVIVLSISGGVGKSIMAAQAARERGARVLAVTNTPGSPLAEIAHETFLLQIHEPAPFLAGTVTFTASLLTLLMIAASLSRAEAGGPEARALAAAVDAVESTLSSEAVVRDWTPAHVGAPVWYILGMGPLEATARYGAAKLVEVADVVAIAHETEEFFHEHHWIVRPDHPVVILAHDAPSRQHAAAAVAHLRELEVSVALIGNDVMVPDGVPRVPLPAAEPPAAPLVAAVPLQWLAYWLSRSRGFDPDRRSHLRGSARYVVSRKYRQDIAPGASREC